MSDYDMDAEAETLDAIIKGVSWQVWRKYRAFLEQADLQQECWLWCLRRQDKVQEYLDREDEVERRRGEAALRLTLDRRCERYARKEKAKVLGYKPSDEYFYTPAQVRDLLDYYYVGDWSARLTQSDNEDPVRRTGSDPAEGHNVLALMADLDAAIKALPPRWEELLVRMHVEPRTVAEVVAEEDGVSPRTIRRREERAIRCIIEFLGGPDPWH